MPSFTDDSETQQAKLIINAAKSAGATHIVHSTNISIPRPEEGKNWDPKSVAAPALEGKQVVEEMVRRAGFTSWTILRPGVFMTNFFTPFVGMMFPDLLTKGLFVSSYRPDTILPLIDPDTIGAFASSAFLDPSKYGGKEIRLTGDPVKVEAIVEAMAKASGKKITASYRSAEESQALAETNPFIAGQLFSLDLYKYIDMAEVRKWEVKLATFQDFLDREHVLVAKTFERVN
ncbi:hypothetical protein CPB83DRAFT_853720 [Crepidotus variabilis]|uniref:NmrA-like domain-containing protein n=1 Tax=Crepidotus variabilis TaxID=179855 RepID=A0A9P6EH21_9AGAR|nr:hypothetical protein CPB83DRAFT_853720 [Crepidotus variabilis]